MKNTVKKMICFAVSMLLLTACLCGCAEVEVTIKNAESETTGKPDFRNFDRENVPEGFSLKQGVEISEEDIAAVIQIVHDYVVSESDLWYIAEVTDEDILKELTQKVGNAGNQNRKDVFGGNGTMPERTGVGNEKPNGDGTGRPGNGQFFGQGNKMRPGNMGNGFGSCILMISALEGSEISAEDVLTATQAEAESLGLQVRSIEVTEEQAELINTKTGYEPTLIVRIGITMPDMREVTE